MLWGRDALKSNQKCKEPNMPICLLPLEFSFTCGSYIFKTTKPQDSPRTCSLHKTIQLLDYKSGTSKGGSIGSTPACGPRDPSSNPAWGKLV